MAIKKYNPTSPGRRGMSTQDFSDITAHEPEKSLLAHKTATSGRNNAGRMEKKKKKKKEE